MFSSLMQFIFPPLCRSCGKLVLKHDVFCDTCYAQIKPLVSLRVPLVQGYVLHVHAAGAYQDPLRHLILQKINRDMSASKHLGMCMTSLLPLDSIPCDALVPIPLHWTRYARRGYNQARQMADVVGKSMEVPVLPLLSRVHKTRFQVEFSRKERKENVKRVFDISWRMQHRVYDLVHGKHIVLVDDLYTTGATISAAANVLVHYKPASMSAIVACRAV